MSNLRSDDVVLVTGGTGFLGQHVVKHLLTDTDVKQVRVFDALSIDDCRVRAFDSVPDGKSVDWIVGNVCNKAEIGSAMAGVTAVIHCAGVVDFRLFPDSQLMHNVNVTGTANVIEACIAHGVTRLVFTSTVDVAVGDTEIVNGDESMPLPRRCLIHGYGHSKQMAEALVLAANGRPLGKEDGSVLLTVCLRPGGMYGECDPSHYLVPRALASAARGRFKRVGSAKSISQHLYVGNAAMAHVCALSALSGKMASRCSGRPYFITDNTPLMNTFEFAEYFIRRCGYSTSSRRLPLWLVYSIMLVFQMILMVLRIAFPVNSRRTIGTLLYTTRTIYFSRSQAETLLGYVPKYDFQTSVENSLRHYITFKP